VPRRPLDDRIVDLARAETDLAAGGLTCPGCGGTLRRWGHARARRVRDHASTTVTLRPRRTRCAACGATHVLLPGAVLPRRADTTAVIGTALLASARGVGYRRIAADLGRPASTVRRWVRSVRDAHTEWLRAQAVGWIVAVDRDVFTTLAPSSTQLGDALNVVAAAALAVQARLAPHVPIWTVVGRVTGWRLVPPGGG
jgi:transposase-like protein